MQTAEQMSAQLLKNLEDGLADLHERLEKADANSPIQTLLIIRKIGEQQFKIEAIKSFRKTMGYK